MSDVKDASYELGEEAAAPGTDVEVVQPGQVEQSQTSTVVPDIPAEWNAAYRLSMRIAGTEFVPRDLRGKPASVMACILAGGELGLKPMQSLAQVHIIEGRPAISASLMRALVNRAGHRIDIDTAKQAEVTMLGTRSDTGATAKVTWTLQDAQRAGLAGKAVWKAYPRHMLLARATSELCRALFPDIIGGLYATDEAADIAGIDHQPAAGELVDPVTQQHVGALPPAPTELQKRKAFALFKACGLDDRAHRLQLTAHWLERDVESWNTVTATEANVVIDRLVELEKAIKAGQVRVEITETGGVAIVLDARTADEREEEEGWDRDA